MNTPAGFSMTAPAILYYLRIDSRFGTLYKIGVTNRTVAERYTPKELRHIKVLKEQRYKLGKWAKAFERQILVHGCADRYHGPDVLRAGNSELFSIDVLGLDS